MNAARWLIALVALAAASGSTLAEWPRPQSDDETPLVIVKFRDSALGKPAAAQSSALQARIGALAARQALELKLARSVSPRTHALWLERPLRGRELDLRYYNGLAWSNSCSCPKIKGQEGRKMCPALPRRDSCLTSAEQEFHAKHVGVVALEGTSTVQSRSRKLSPHCAKTGQVSWALP